MRTRATFSRLESHRRQHREPDVLMESQRVASAPHLGARPIAEAMQDYGMILVHEVNVTYADDPTL